jgi:hypothetical protein
LRNRKKPTKPVSTATVDPKTIRLSDKGDGSLHFPVLELVPKGTAGSSKTLFLLSLNIPSDEFSELFGLDCVSSSVSESSFAKHFKGYNFNNRWVDIIFVVLRSGRPEGLAFGAIRKQTTLEMRKAKIVQTRSFMKSMRPSFGYILRTHKR